MEATHTPGRRREGRGLSPPPLAAARLPLPPLPGRGLPLRRPAGIPGLTAGLPGRSGSCFVLVHSLRGSAAIVAHSGGSSPPAFGAAPLLGGAWPSFLLLSPWAGSRAGPLPLRGGRAPGGVVVVGRRGAPVLRCGRSGGLASPANRRGGPAPLRVLCWSWVRCRRPLLCGRGAAGVLVGLAAFRWGARRGPPAPASLAVRAGSPLVFGPAGPPAPLARFSYSGALCSGSKTGWPAARACPSYWPLLR